MRLVRYAARIEHEDGIEVYTRLTIKEAYAIADEARKDGKTAVVYQMYGENGEVKREVIEQ